MDDVIQIRRSKLTAAVLVSHVRPVRGGEFVRNGWSCRLCNKETTDEALTMLPQDHEPDCVLYKPPKRQS